MSEPIEPITTAALETESFSGIFALAVNRLNAAIDRINDLEAKYEGHTHRCYTNKDSHDPLIGNTGLPIVDTTPKDSRHE